MQKFVKINKQIKTTSDKDYVMLNLTKIRNKN